MCYNTRMAKIEKPCRVCGAPVWRYLSEWNHRPVPLCSTPCVKQHRSETNRGEKNPDWKGGRYIEPGKGYVMVRNPGHPRARQNGYVLEHILVAEEMLGRPLKPGEVVHHRNEKMADNRPENLEVYESNVAHRLENGHYTPKHPPCRCGRPASSHGLCFRHQAQLKRTGRTWGFD